MAFRAPWRRREGLILIGHRGAQELGRQRPRFGRRASMALGGRRDDGARSRQGGPDEPAAVIPVVPDRQGDQNRRHQGGESDERAVQKTVHQGTITLPPWLGPNEAGRAVPF